MTVDYLLYESSVGYAVYKVKLQADSIGSRLKEVQASVQDLALFGKSVKLVSFAPFKGASQALENINDISEGIVSDYLKAILEANLPKANKSHKAVLGVSDKILAGNIKAIFPYINCETSETNEAVAELLRGLRLHAPKLLKQLQTGDVERAQLGLGHAYSRAKVKFSVQKNDNHIIQAIATLDYLDKSVNSFSMRVREWYSWHFPELIKIVSENQLYAKVVLFIGDKNNLTDDKLHDLAAIVGDDGGLAKGIIDAARVSMGREISESDMENIISFAKRAVRLAEVRKHVHGYLVSKMGVVAPNLAALIGETVGARLISRAGSLTNLAKHAASTVQVLGAEKALFRALKTKGSTPKYGLIYHSTFIGRAGPKDKGRISRFLANKCSMASRIDNFTQNPTTKFGEVLRQQVEERLEFYNSGARPTSNKDAMKRAMDSVLENIDVSDLGGQAKSSKKEKKTKKSKDQGLENGQPLADVEKATKRKRSSKPDETGEGIAVRTKKEKISKGSKDGHEEVRRKKGSSKIS